MTYSTVSFRHVAVLHQYSIFAIQTKHLAMSVAALNVGAALLINRQDLRSSIKLTIITVFVYVGIMVAPRIASLQVSA